MKKIPFCLLCVLLISAFDAFSLDLYEDIIRPGQDLVGSPYRTGGTTPAGFDCSGFVLYLYGRHSPGLPRISRQMASFGTPVRREAIIPGDLVFFTTGSSPSAVTHVAIYIGQNSILHSISNGPNRGVTITSLSARYWNRRYYSAVRVLEERKSPADPSPAEEIRSVADMRFAKGRYSGDVVQGEPEGEGILVMNNGDRYEGGFSGGLFEGQGTYYWADGRSQTGEFRNGRFTETQVRGDNYMEKKDSPWETWDGIVEGDFQLWLQQEKDAFEEWKKQN